MPHRPEPTPAASIRRLPCVRSLGRVLGVVVMTVWMSALPSDPAAAQTANEAAIADHLSAIRAAGGAPADLQTLLDDLESTPADEIPVTRALSPEAYDAQTTVVVEAGRQIARLLLDRPRQCVPGALEHWAGDTTPLPCHPRKAALWLAGTGSFRNREAFAGHPRYDAQLGGLVVGFDLRPIEPLELTFAISSQRGEVDVALAGASTLTLTDVSGHAAWTQGPVRAQGVISWGHGFHDDSRDIRFETASPVNVQSTENHDSDRITLAGEVGLEARLGPFDVEPLVGIDWAWVFQRSISESGAGGLGLRIDDRDDSIGSVHAGLRASTAYHQTGYLIPAFEWTKGVWRPRLDVRWREIVDGDEREVEARLRGAPEGVPGFTIQGKEDKRGLEFGGGLSFVPTGANRLQIDLRYQAFVASHTLEQDVTVQIGMGF